jgi:hypothetical protein
MGMWGNAVASGFSIQSDRGGDGGSVFSAPSPLIWIIGGRTIWNAFIGIVNGLFVLVAAMVIFQTPLEVADLGLFMLAFVLTLLSLAALGMLFSAAFVLTRSAQVLTNGLEFPIYSRTGRHFRSSAAIGRTRCSIAWHRHGASRHKVRRLPAYADARRRVLGGHPVHDHPGPGLCDRLHLAL